MKDLRAHLQRPAVQLLLAALFLMALGFFCGWVSAKGLWDTTIATLFGLLAGKAVKL
ncbi:hypothetical protein [Deinococcus hopiensis]|uniref:Uncharacterized protein n=1 Tax=Deinococcus hopiensis KR-140 TaxID=695939 RepID=A0A1W1VJ38_9DEIO|nr:hypothetical protein [Deinococcus hopiensis]SMB93387.1 hypothetical protein SAMN00790413_01961 [Deinococcus hopiensis KR-140]